MMGVGASVAGGIVAGVVAAFSFQWVIDAIGDAIRGAARQAGLDNDLPLGPGDLPWMQRAAGGPARGLTIVGEGGPELLKLPAGSHVYSNRQSRARWAGGGPARHTERRRERSQVGVGDPVAIGREVDRVLRVYRKRAGILSAGPDGMTRYLEDTFARTVGTAGRTPGSWGTADFGGAWTVGRIDRAARSERTARAGASSGTAAAGAPATGCSTAPSRPSRCTGAMHARLNIGTQLGSGILWVRCSGPVATFTGYGIRLGRSSTGGLNAELLRGPQDAPVIIATMAGSPTWPDYTDVLPGRARGRWAATRRPYAGDGSRPAAPRPMMRAGRPSPTRRGPRLPACTGSGGSARAAWRPSTTSTRCGWPTPSGRRSRPRPGPTASRSRSASSTLTTGDPRAHGWTFGDGTDAVVADPVQGVRGRGHVHRDVHGVDGLGHAPDRHPIRGRGPAPVPEDIRPAVFVNGEDICDRVYSMTWETGRERWPDESNGSSASRINIRGRMPDVQMGAPVIVQLPMGAPDGTATAVDGRGGRHHGGNRPHRGRPRPRPRGDGRDGVPVAMAHPAGLDVRGGRAADQAASAWPRGARPCIGRSGRAWRARGGRRSRACR